jgi:hypothetical protein
VDSLWNLPGPAQLLSQATRNLARGRHLAVVVPEYLSADKSFGADLVDALMASTQNAGHDPVRVTTDGCAAEPLDLLAEALVFDDDRPRVVADLLDHPDAAGRTAVVDCTTLDPPGCADIARLLGRLVVESRPRAPHRRPCVITVGTRRCLPAGTAGEADVTFEALWWSGHLTRWDAAARLLPAVDRLRATPGILRDIMLESLVEVCQWDVRLADSLAAGWNGDPANLRIDSERPDPPEITDTVPRTPGTKPPAYIIDHWDAGTVDLWHGRYSPGVGGPKAGDMVTRRLWAAQVRAILPWVESCRADLAEFLLSRHGRRAVDRAIDAAASDQSGGPLEVGPLFVAVHRLTGSEQPALRDAAFRLKEARNRLAHLGVLSLAEQRELIDAFSHRGDVADHMSFAGTAIGDVSRSW